LVQGRSHTSSALGNITVYEYGHDFNLLKIIGPLGHETSTACDGRGNMLSTTDPGRAARLCRPYIMEMFGEAAELKRVK